MREKYITEMTLFIRKRESNKAKLLVEEMRRKIPHHSYAQAFIGVVLAESRKRLCDEIPAFYTEEQPFLDKLFPQGVSACFEDAIDVLCEAVKSSEKENKKKIFLKAIAYIDENLTDCTLSVGDAADYAGVSPAVLSKTFALYKGVTPATYIAQRRVERTMEELKKDGASIREIALDAGFSSAEAYIRVFRKYHGMPPGKWNKLFLSKNRI